MTEKLKVVLSRTFRSLKTPNYRRYFYAQIVSMTGTWMQSVAQMWLVLSLTGSAVALGVTSALQFAPMLLFGAWGGVLADRFDKRKMLLVTQAMAAVLALALGVITITGVVELWMVYAITAAWGFVIMIDNPTRQSFLSELVSENDLPNAVGLNSAVVTAARTFGPALAGIIISLAGAGFCFLLNGFSYIAVIFALLRLDLGALDRGRPAGRQRGQLREGLRYVWNTPVLRGTLLLMAVVGTLAFNFRMFVPLLASEVFAGGAGTLGVLSALMGVGTVVGALTVASRGAPTRKALLLSALGFGVSILLLAAAPTLGWALAAIAPMGAISVVFAATANSTLQLEAAPAMRGRVMALYAVVFLGSTPIGGPLMGFIAESMGTRAALTVAGIATVAAALVSGRRRIRIEVHSAADRVGWSAGRSDPGPSRGPAQGSEGARASLSGRRPLVGRSRRPGKRSTKD